MIHFGIKHLIMIITHWVFESCLDRVQGAPLGSQSPHLFWIGGDRLLGVAGGYSPDVVGGAALHPLRLGWRLLGGCKD